MTGIYKITSPSHRIYIGESVDIEKRWKQYENFSGNSSSIGPKLLNSFKKYGFNNHKFEVIEECNLENLDGMEVFWKKHYFNLFDSNWKHFLFCELYDRGGGPRSEETKIKMSISQKLNLSKPEVIKIRKINCTIAANKPGVQEKAVKNTNWGLRNKKLLKPVVQLSLNGEFIREYPSLISIQTLNKDKKWWASEIGMCCRKLIETKYGFKWKYKDTK